MEVGTTNRAKKLGFGDLSPDDFRRIAGELQEDELFIILCEQDSFWNFVTRKNPYAGFLNKAAPSAEAPGVDYVSQHAMYAIA